MEVNAEQIKKALIEIANINKRPNFELTVIRDVVFAIQNQCYHPLKERVLHHIENEIEHRSRTVDREQNMRLIKLRNACTSEAIKYYLAEKSGIGVKLINNMVKGRYEVTAADWASIEPVIDQLISPKMKSH